MNFSAKLLLGLGLTLTIAACDRTPEPTPEAKPTFHTSDAYAPDQDARPWTHLNFDNDPDNFQFAVITDRTGGHRPGVFPAIMKKANLMQPEFIMSVGDYIEGYTLDKTKLYAEWAEVDEFIGTLEAPLFFTVGNHDIANQSMEDLWLERSAKTQYHFIYKNTLFLVLNTEDTPHPSPEAQELLAEAMVALDEGDMKEAIRIGQKNPPLSNYLSESGKLRINDTQRDWALGVLEENKDVRWTFVFMHRPVWTAPTPNFTKIEEALQGRGFTMLAGHVHNYTYEQRQGQDFISLGTNGGMWSGGPAQGEMDHITWITMNDEGPVFANLVATGILAKDEIPTTIPGAEFCGVAYDIPCVYSAPAPTPAEE